MKNIWSFIIGVLLMALGVYVVFNPASALLSLAFLFGLAFMIIGVGYIMSFGYLNSYVMLTMGVLNMLIGMIFLGNLGITAASLPIIFALWALFVGAIQIGDAAQLKDMDKDWRWTFWAGIFGIIFGFLILMYPIVGAVIITLLMGSYLMIYGVFEVVTCCKPAKANKAAMVIVEPIAPVVVAKKVVAKKTPAKKAVAKKVAAKKTPAKKRKK